MPKNGETYSVFSTLLLALATIACVITFFLFIFPDNDDSGDSETVASATDAPMEIKAPTKAPTPPKAPEGSEESIPVTITIDEPAGASITQDTEELEEEKTEQAPKETLTATPTVKPAEYVQIKGKQYNAEIETLELQGKQLQGSDLASLKLLTNLRVLYLGLNQASDISHLSGLSNLTNLYLDGNQISNIKPLSELRNLTALNVGYNQISDISPLRDG
ncbi:MAG: leucine-rich repeat domain-containing protein [Clostridiales bacterium]|nr:leucine-rich repeat domain-containing protein [Clostridiales bacterium]